MWYLMKKMGPLRFCPSMKSNYDVFGLMSITFFRNLSGRRKSKMRYFVNPYDDYNGQNFSIDADLWRGRIDELAENLQFHLRRVTGDNCDGGIYVGPAGIGFALLKLAENEENVKLKKDRLAFAEKLVEKNMDHYPACRDAQSKVSFLLGAMGANAVASAIYKERGKLRESDAAAAKYAENADFYAKVDLFSFGGEEFFVGKSGFLCGAMWLNRVLQKQVVSPDQMRKVCDSIIEAGRSYIRRRSANHIQPPPALMFAYHGTEYLGAAHGLSSILQMIISVPDFIRNSPPDVQKDVKSSIDYLLSLQNQETFNFPTAMDEVAPNLPRDKEHDLVHWCHGSPGTAYLLARSYLVYGEQKYLEAALKCGECCWKYGLLKKGPGICHGVSGNGYVFLLLYRLTGDRKHLYRALMFAEFLYTKKFEEARTPDAPFSLFEGDAGTLCFLIDLLKPEKGSFPFFDSVF